jgi:hypothetical protein
VKNIHKTYILGQFVEYEFSIIIFETTHKSILLLKLMVKSEPKKMCVNKVVSFGALRKDGRENYLFKTTLKLTSLFDPRIFFKN